MALHNSLRTVWDTDSCCCCAKRSSASRSVVFTLMVTGIDRCNVFTVSSPVPYMICCDRATHIIRHNGNGMHTMSYGRICMGASCSIGSWRMGEGFQGGVGTVISD
jgi:hypothetical protein